MGVTSEKASDGIVSLDEIVPRLELVGLWDFKQDHWHRYHLPSHHLLFVESGAVEATGLGAKTAVIGRAGDLLWFRPSAFNEYRNRGPTMFWQAQLSFSRPPRQRATPWFNECGSIPTQLALGERAADVRRIFQTFCAELPKPGASHALRIRAAVFELLAILAELATGRGKQDFAPPPVDPWEQARQRLESCFDGRLKISDLAKEMRFTPDHFIRQFKRRYGVSPKALEMQARLREAARLLSGTNQPVKAIAYRLGFSDPKSFSQVFRRHLGVRPKDLRERTQPMGPELRVRQRRLYPINEHILPPLSPADWQRKYQVNHVVIGTRRGN